MLPINGFLIIDKPSGITSHTAVEDVRRKLKIQKVGHLGTLDPIATGVLVMAIGRATKLVKYFIDDNKEYRTTMKLGVVTDTQDLDGKILQESTSIDVSREKVEQVFQQFVGDIEQIPPMVSAKKIGGKRLYKLHRKGIEVERKPKKIRIDYMNMIEFNLPLVIFEVKCSKGTYVRTICDDIGQKLGTGGAMAGLVRLKSGFFELSDAVTLKQLEQMDTEQIMRKIISPMLALKRKNAPANGLSQSL